MPVEVAGQVLAVAALALSVVVAVLLAAVVGPVDIALLAAPFVELAAAAAAAELVLAIELAEFFSSSYQYCALIAAVSASESTRRCIRQKISLIDIMIPRDVWPSVAISLTNLAAHLVCAVSTNGQFSQSSSDVHYSLDHSAILRSDLDENITMLPVVEVLEQRRVVAEPAELAVAA